MEKIYANLTACVSELNKNPTALIKKANGRSVAIINHNKPVAYLISVGAYENMQNILEDVELSELVAERMKEKDQAIIVSLDHL